MNENHIEARKALRTRPCILHAYAVRPLYRAKRAANLSSARKAYPESDPDHLTPMKGVK
jgi:hypothetical protein